MADFNHIDYTDELNRIIVALTDIRDDIRLIRRRGEDCGVGLVMNKVFNDLERALLTTSLASSGALSGVGDEISNPTVTPFDGGETTTPTGEDTVSARTTILEQLGIEDTGENASKTLLRLNGLYYWEQQYSGSGPDDGTRTNFVPDGGSIGYHDLSSDTAKPGSPPSADAIDVTATRKRWPPLRTAGTPAITNPSRDADLINTTTGTLAGLTIEEQNENFNTDTDQPLGRSVPAAQPNISPTNPLSYADPDDLEGQFGPF